MKIRLPFILCFLSAALLCRAADFTLRIDAPGVCAAIAVNDKPPEILCAGYADLRNKEKITPDTLFKCGSVIKTFTGFLVFDLLQRKNLPIQTKLNELGGRFDTLCKKYPPLKDITVLQLLTHTSGLPDFQETFPYLRMFTSLKKKPILPWAFVEFALANSEYNESQDFQYSNLNYLILGIVVEELSGQPFIEAVRDNVTEPLIMPKSSVYISLNEKIARAYAAINLLNVSLFATSPVSNYLDISDLVDDSWDEWSAGALISTPEDLLIGFRNLIFQTNFLNDCRRHCFPVHPFDNKIPLVKAKEYRYSLGIWQLCFQEGCSFWQAVGEQWGFKAGILYFPARNENEKHIFFSYAVNTDKDSLEEGFVSKLIPFLDEMRRSNGNSSFVIEQADVADQPGEVVAAPYQCFEKSLPD